MLVFDLADGEAAMIEEEDEPEVEEDDPEDDFGDGGLEDESEEED